MRYRRRSGAGSGQRGGFGLLASGLLLACVVAPRSVQAGADESFETIIRPILAKNCYPCHSEQAGKRKGGLALDRGSELLRGGTSGPAVIPGRPDESPLVRAIRYGDPDLEMPPDERLGREAVAAIEAWVKAGAPMPADERRVAQPPTGPLWSVAPLRRATPPRVKDVRWPLDDVDRFLLARLEAEGLPPARDADRETWLRRVTFDLTGLPPTPREREAFLADRSAQAYETVVDRLLASPQYGVRWGRHWLDLVRYGDTSGCNADFPIDDAYRYRNWVIGAFNADLPYAEFVEAQIAGDLLAAKAEDEAGRRALFAATGYLALAKRFGSRADEHHLTIDDTIDNLGKTFLGLSLGCARCHDHKYDPIPQRDYYALFGIFASTRYPFPGTELYRHPRDSILFGAPEQVAMRKKVEAERAALGEKSETLSQELKTLRPAAGAKGLAPKGERTAEQVKRELADARFQLEQLDESEPEVERIFAVAEGKPEDARVYFKGDPKTPGPVVPRGFLTVLGGAKIPAGETGSGRRQLASWLTEAENPLVWRVVVNRIWQHHFGTGIVPTSSDFGHRGTPPSHPELLDWLALKFREEGGSWKRLHRRLVLSRAYRLTSAASGPLVDKDPANRLFGRFARRRLSAEEIRDAMLATSGVLDPTPGAGFPFPPERDRHYTQHKPFVASYPSVRRSAYLFVQRGRKDPFFEVFDGADPNASVAVRPVSTTALQSLFLLNDATINELGDRMAARIGLALRDDDARLRQAVLLAFGRAATPADLVDGRRFLHTMDAALARAGVPAEERARRAFASFCRTLFGSNEFLHVE